MKNMLIATDFSPAARDAARYTMRLAEVFGSSVSLVSVYSTLPVTVSESLAVVTTFDKRKTIVERLAAEASVLTPGAESVHTIAKEGPRVESILAVAGQVGAELIVVGMKDEGRKTRRLFGSTVTGLARKTTIPILVIPEGFGFSPPAAIALSNDKTLDRNLQRVAVVRQITGRFEPTVYVVRIFGHTVRRVCRGLMRFIESHAIDLLVMTPHRRFGSASWFMRSHTRIMLFRVHIPLLILPA